MSQTTLSDSQPSAAPELESRMAIDISECGQDGGHGVFDFQCPSGEEILGEVFAGVCCVSF